MDKHHQDFFAKNLKHLIEKNNIKKVDLAKHLGLSKSAISNYVSGVSVPKLDTISKLASYFDVNFDKLISKKLDMSEATFNEKGNLVYELPLFSKTLISDEVIFRNDNYIGNITSPIPVNEDNECYAVMVYDDSMRSYGISKGSVAVFTTSVTAENGDFAAVYTKSNKQIYVRLLNSDSHKITLTSDTGTEVFKNSQKNSEVVILGKIIFATFYPNSK